MVNSNQEIAIKKCIAVLDGWLTTNDINSPSHYDIIDEYMSDLEEDIWDETSPDLIHDSLVDLLNIIKNIK